MGQPARSQLPPHTSLAPSSPRLRVNQISRTLSWWTALTWTWTPNEFVVVVSFCCRTLILSFCDSKTRPKIPRALNLSSSSNSHILVFHVPLLFEQIKFYILF